MNKLTIKDLCEGLGITRPTLYKYIDQGKIPEPRKTDTGRAYWNSEDVDLLTVPQLLYIELYGVTKDGHCTCHRAHECSTPGKHPVPSNWQNATPLDKDQRERVLEKGNNLGILTGSRSNIFILDIDVKSGGISSLNDLLDEHGPLPTTKTVSTGSGGVHYYFRTPQGVQIHNSASKVGPGIDIRGNNGQAVAPPSMHKSQKKYVWQTPPDTPVSDPPEWLLKLIKRYENAPPPDLSKESKPIIVEGERDSRLFEEAKVLVRMGWDTQSIYRSLQARNELHVSPKLPDSDLLRIAQQAPKYTESHEEIEGLETTDAGNGIRFAKRFSNSTKCIIDSPTKQTWYIYDGQRWANDGQVNAIIMNKAEEVARAIPAEAVAIQDPKDVQTLYKHAERSLSVQSLKNMLTMAATHPSITTAPQHFDPDPHKLNLQNGTYDLTTHTLDKHNPKDMISKIAPYPYSPEAECPRFNQFLEEIFQGNQEVITWVQEYVGACLTGRIVPIVLMLVGHGSNGKSVLVNVINALLAEYSSKVPSKLFIRSAAKSDNEKDYILNDLRGKRFGYSSELNENEQFAAATIKEITSNEPLKVRRMFGEYYPMEMTAKIALTTNSLPIIRDLTYGTWRRIRVIHFNETFHPPSEIEPGEELLKLPRDEFLEDKMKTELSGILNWALVGLRRLQANNFEFSACKTMRKWGEAYQQDEDVIGDWLETFCDLDPDAKTLRSDVLNSVKQHTSLNSISQQYLAKKLEQKNIHKDRRYYIGLKFKHDAHQTGTSHHSATDGIPF